MQYRLYYKRKLPHYQPRDGSFFITMRLAFQLPEKYLLAMNRYREALNIQYVQSQENHEVKRIIKKKSFAYEDDLLALCSWEVDLTQALVAQIIQDKLLDRQSVLYYLYAYTIMPNHVHILLRPLSVNDKPVGLSNIIKDFKGCTAHSINTALNRQGRLWFPEYFDHWIRTQQELINVIEYIRNNPVKAGLVKDATKWQWTWVNPDLWQEL